MKYMSVDGMISLAGGLPHPSLFPFINIEAEVYSPGIYLPSNTSESDSELLRFRVHKNGRENGQVVDLASGLQYGMFLRFLHKVLSINSRFSTHCWSSMATPICPGVCARRLSTSL